MSRWVDGTVDGSVELDETCYIQSLEVLADFETLLLLVLSNSGKRTWGGSSQPLVPSLKFRKKNTLGNCYNLPN
jgi:hypothetical protein